MKAYSYPFPFECSSQEIADVIALWVALEAAYEGGIDRQEFLDKYKGFKKIIPSKMEEKQLAKEFAQASGYELYPTVKKAQQESVNTIKMA